MRELIAIDFNELNLSKLKKDFDNISNENRLTKHFYLINLNKNELLEKIIEKHNLFLYSMQRLINMLML